MGSGNNYKPIHGIVAILLIGGFVTLLIYLIHLQTIKWPAEQRQSDYWEQEAKASPKNFQLICPPSNDGEPIPAEDCERSGYYEYDRKQQVADHRAQISMRNAAWLTAVFTGFGLLLVGVTLYEAWKAAGFARDALDVTKAEQRPWITLELHLEKVFQMNLNGAPMVACNIKVIAKNIGKTPAQKVAVTCEASPCEGWLSTFIELFEQDVIESKIKDKGHVLLPEEDVERRFTLRFMPETFINSALGGGRGNDCPYFIAKVTYDAANADCGKTAIGGVFKAEKSMNRSLRLNDIRPNMVQLHEVNGAKFAS